MTLLGLVLQLPSPALSFSGLRPPTCKMQVLPQAEGGAGQWAVLQEEGPSRGAEPRPVFGLWPEATQEGGCPRNACFQRENGFHKLDCPQPGFGAGRKAPNSKPDL